MKVNHNELKEQIKIAYDTKTPLFIWGTTGIGKSDSVRNVAKEIAKKEGLEYSEDDVENGKFGFIDIRISQLEPSDLRGLPTINGDRTKWLIPSLAVFFSVINSRSQKIQLLLYFNLIDFGFFILF